MASDVSGVGTPSISLVPRMELALADVNFAKLIISECNWKEQSALAQKHIEIAKFFLDKLSSEVNSDQYLHQAIALLFKEYKTVLEAMSAYTVRNTFALYHSSRWPSLRPLIYAHPSLMDAMFSHTYSTPLTPFDMVVFTFVEEYLEVEIIMPERLLLVLNNPFLTAHIPYKWFKKNIDTYPLLYSAHWDTIKPLMQKFPEFAQDVECIEMQKDAAKQAAIKIKREEEKMRLLSTQFEKFQIDTPKEQKKPRRHSH